MFISWSRPQTLASQDSDPDLLQLSPCDQDCDFSTVPTPIPSASPPPNSPSKRPPTNPSPSERQKNLEDEYDDVYIYMGIGVAFSVILLAVLVAIILYCVRKRRALEKVLANAQVTEGTDIVPVSRSHGGKNKSSVEEKEEESHYDYIDEGRLARSDSYSELREESKYNHDYKSLSQPQHSGEVEDLEYVELEDARSTRGQSLPEFAIYSSGSQLSVEGGATIVYSTPQTQKNTESDDLNDYLEPSPQPSFRGASPSAPVMGYNSYLEVLPPAPRPDPTMTPVRGVSAVRAPIMTPVKGQCLRGSSKTSVIDKILLRVSGLKGQGHAAGGRGKGRSSLPPQSVAESLGPQPPLPKRNATFHTYSHAEIL